MHIRILVAVIIILMWPAGSSGLTGQDKNTVDDCVRHFEAGRLPEARACFEKALEEDSEAHAALYYLGRISLIQNDPDGAIEFFEKAVKKDETNSVYHGWLGSAYIEKLQTASFFEKGTLSGRVIEHLRKAIKLDPQNIEARIRLTHYYLSAPSIAGGSKLKAKEQIETIMRYAPAEGHYLRASIYAREKEFDLAVEELKKCIDAQPDEIEYHYTLGMIYQETERYDDAFEAFERALGIDPLAAGPLYQIGRTAAFSGKNLERGIECLLSYLGREAEPGNPGHDGAYWRLGMIYEKQGNRDKARQSFERAIELNPSEKRYRESINALDKN